MEHGVLKDKLVPVTLTQSSRELSETERQEGGINIKAISGCTVLPSLSPSHLSHSLIPLPHPVTLYCLVLFTGSRCLSHYSCFKHAHTSSRVSSITDWKWPRGTEREVKGIVQVCEVGAKRGNETERKRGGDGGGGSWRVWQTERRANERREGGLLRPMKVGVKKSKAS